MKNLTKTFAVISLISNLTLVQIPQLRAAEPEDVAMKAEIERRVNEELAKRQKTEGASALLTNIYAYYSDNLIGQSKNLNEVSEKDKDTKWAVGGGAVGTGFAGVFYAVTLGERANDPGVKGFRRASKGLALVSIPLTIWGIHRGIKDAPLMKTKQVLVDSRVSDEYYKKLPQATAGKKWTELKRDITAGWNLDKLFSKYGDEQQAMLFETLYEKAKQEVLDYLKDIPMDKDPKDKFVSEIAAERAMRRYLSLEASPDTQKDIQKWLDLNAESMKDLAKKVTASSEVLKPHAQSGTAGMPAESHTDGK